MPIRVAGVSGLLALVTVLIGWIGGALAQPDAYSSADDISDPDAAESLNKRDVAAATSIHRFRTEGVAGSSPAS